MPYCIPRYHIQPCILGSQGGKVNGSSYSLMILQGVIVPDIKNIYPMLRGTGTGVWWAHENPPIFGQGTAKEHFPSVHLVPHFREKKYLVGPFAVFRM